MILRKRRRKELDIMLLYLLLFVYGGVNGNTVVNPNIASQFLSTDTSQFNHITLDVRTGNIYAGAVNRLYQLNSDLKLLQEVRTGPKLDSPLCHASGCGSPDIPKVPTDNYNKILLVNPSLETLIVCGSVLQGSCDIYPLANISLPSKFIPRSIAANDPKATSFAFIGKEHYNKWETTDVMYVATTFTTNGDYRHDVPAITTRRLQDLKLAENSFSKQSLLRVDVKYRDNFLVNYIYGFNTTDFAYFVTVQKKNYLPGQEEAGYVSRLVRTCVSDANYNSYTEITLECNSPGGTEYNLVQDAQLVHAGKELARNLGVEEGDLVLVGVFSPSRGHTKEGQDRSAVCLYSLREVEKKFNENIHMCFNGSMKYRNMGYISGPVLNGECPQAGVSRY